MVYILETNELIRKLRDEKGITFKFYSEEEAEEFLEKHNYYVKLTAYKTNFHKHDNKYVGLDFLALKDLSTIDMYIKKWILNASLAVEHSLKVNILKDMQERNINEFEIVSDYFHKYPRILSEIEYRRETPYTKKLLQKYNHPFYPIWVFLEVIPFGEFVNFYKYYCNINSFCDFEPGLLYNVKNVRNAAAHNNCVIYDLYDRTGYYNSNLAKKLEDILIDTRRATIQNRLRNKSVQDFASLLIAVEELIKSDELRYKNLEEIKKLFDERMIKNNYLYRSSPVIKQTYRFLKGIIDILEVRNYNIITNWKQMFCE